MNIFRRPKKPTLVYPETFIAEREVNGQKEYAFGIRRKFLWWSSIYITYTDKLTRKHKVLYFDSPEIIQRAIDNLRKDVEKEYQRKLKQYERSQASNWTFKKYP